MNTLCRSKQAPFEYTLSLIGGKWKMRILYELACEKTMRYGELKRAMPLITHKMLSSQLKELQTDGLINRVEISLNPLRVEYSLSDRGLSLYPLIDEMCRWEQSEGLPYE
ncbi:winged helix-turn-helix transcriptional regulator [Bacillus haynesii]|uniref:winged helix-turn-helix transcriptional regulator n=1 Tax=Bacillus haynesii TaxID=1925021 RepID=UPI00227F46F1|nr:winged helix-turn-helix transcriptional regulator [Bacillus haynesii]MCY7772148.1 winged helix-turn-helix transcriptional regulator [Bacillus haynesii]MCY8011248.1 winged helix-turn-helix transcriptional regulator [Bacillus haynesii]MEC0763942.1 winged helix-turn-helix transcriptional regulator [Bacillus haynesii]MEC0784836.1 winged helix-turn-helix transcriptional regulator [Bacillus haynesii]